MPRTKLAISYNFPHFLHRDSLGVPFQLKDKHGKPDLFLSLINFTYSDLTRLLGTVIYKQGAGDGIHMAVQMD